MIKLDDIWAITLEYDPERDRMLTVVAVNYIKYKCYSVHINDLTGHLCMTGIVGIG